jgi:multiple sugar transport system ATP-binding protein
MAVVELRNVTKAYEGGDPAVTDLSLTIEDHELMVLVGPSGCGKSTTLRMVAGLEELTDGEIFIDGQQVNALPPKDRDIAMVFQNYALYPHMSVYKNMAFGLTMRKTPKAEIDERVQQAAQILGLQDLLQRKPKALSGGERQRVALGRAIVRDPKVFLFDEPLSNLDAQLRVQMRAEITKLHHRLNATMIYVTHDQVEAMTMGDRIAVMKDGQIQQIATPGALYQHPQNKFVAAFIGSPPMNFIEGTLRTDDGDLHFTDATGLITLPIHAQHRAALQPYLDHPITLGLRPDAFTHNAAQPDAAITAPLDNIEPTGPHTNLYLTIGDTTIIAQVDAGPSPTLGEDHTLHITMDRAHYFDGATDQAIIAPPASPQMPTA